MRLQTLGPLLLASAALAACTSTPVAPQAGASSAMHAPAPGPTAATPSATAKPAPAPALPAYLDPKNPISTERSVYFAYDEFTIDGRYTPLLERQGKFLAAHPELAIKVEGSADERGSPEYNLALGQKRAQAVAQALKVYGVKDNQMEAISWGEERPKVSAHDEESWAQNRRADLQYPTR